MALEYIGFVIQRERKRQHLQQRELYKEICSISTLSRIERGLLTPTRSVLRPILQRLGLPEDLCKIVQSQRDLEIDAQMQEVRARTIGFVKAAPEDRPACRAYALEAIETLEGMADPEDRALQQFIQDERLGLGREDGSPYPPEELRERLLEILRMTQPDFDLEHIEEFRYTHEETDLINQIAITYAQKGQRQRAINIYRQLLRCTQSEDLNLPRYAYQYTLLSAGLALELRKAEQYEEAIDVAQRGRRVCVKYSRHEYLPVLLSILANNHAHLEHSEEATMLYWRAWHFYAELNDVDNLVRLCNDARDTLGLKLPDINHHSV